MRDARATAHPTSRRIRRALVVLGLLALGGVGLFVWNGLVLAAGERVTTGTEPEPAVVGADDRASGRTIRVIAWNLAKVFVHRGGFTFASREAVEARLEEIAAVLRRERPHLVFLSEVVTECTPCDVDQVRFLAREAQLPHWAFGENYNFGLPFLRVVGGNAILSATPIEPLANPDLAGRRAFWITHNNRRFLLCSTRIGEAEVLLGSVHTDSFDLANNLRQTHQILGLLDGRPAVLAGDFNATPGDASLAAIRESGAFSGAVEGPATFPARAPDARIDYVFAPRTWTLLEHRVLDDQTSDHRPVLATFEVVTERTGSNR